MAGAVVFGFLDAVGVVPAALDDAGVGALAALVQVAGAGDVRHHAGERQVALVRGKAGSATRRRTARMVRLSLTRSGSMPAVVAAVQVRALIA